MQNLLNSTKYYIPTIALIFAIGVLMFNLSPCNIASGQVVCGASINRTFINNLHIDSNIFLESTPTSGVAGQFFRSAGASLPAEWAEIEFASVFKPANTTRTLDDVLSNDPDLFFSFLGNSTYHIFGYLNIFETGGDFKFRFNVGGDGAGMIVDHTQPGVEFLEGDTVTFILPDDPNALTYPFWLTIETPTNGGTLFLEWSQDISSAIGTSLAINSVMFFSKVGSD